MKNYSMFLVYFHGADFFEQVYFTNLESAKEFYEEQCVEYSDESYGSHYEKVLMLVGLDGGDRIFSSTYGDVVSNTGICFYDFENSVSIEQEKINC